LLVLTTFFSTTFSFITFNAGFCLLAVGDARLLAVGEPRLLAPGEPLALVGDFFPKN
jgi:hypothetical protein